VFEKQLGRILSLFRGKPGEQALATELADALGKAQQKLEHRGSIKLTHEFPRHDRAFSGHAASVAQKYDTFPFRNPVVSAAVLEVSAGGDYDAHRRGERGFAIHVKDGILRGSDQNWLVKWAKVITCGTFLDSRTSELSSGIAVTHYFADCYECDDIKGRNLGQHIRIARPTEFPKPQPDDIIGYCYTENEGMPVEWIRGRASGQLQWALAMADWEWDDVEARAWPAQPNVGRVSCRLAHDRFGAAAAPPNFYVYLIGTREKDPNVHTGDVLGFIEDENGLKIAVAPDGLDAKIGSVKIWTGTFANIPPGWVHYTGLAGRVPFGLSTSDCLYTTQGDTGGLHPIRPKEHRDDEPATCNQVWWTDCNSTPYYETSWGIDDHDPPKETLTAYTGIEVLSTTVRVETSHVYGTISTTAVTVEATSISMDSQASTCQNADLTISVSGDVNVVTHSGNSGTQALTALAGYGDVASQSLSLSGNVGTTVLTIATADPGHPIHEHKNVVCSWLVSDVTCATCPDVSTELVWHWSEMPDCDEGDFDWCDNSQVHEHDISPNGHTHAFGNLAISPNPHDHATGSHSHPIDPDPHSHSINHDHTASHNITADDVPHSHTLLGHIHTLSPDPHDHDSPSHDHDFDDGVGHVHNLIPDPHGHAITDPGHCHSTRVLTHYGVLCHRTEDYRPPFRVEIWIQRVGPDDD